MNKQNLIAILLLLGALCLLAACAPAGSEPAADETEMENMEGMDHDEDTAEHDKMAEAGHDHPSHEHNHKCDIERIKNNGASIEIVSPQTGDRFAVGEQVVVEVEVENFELGVEGSHWHVYVDGSSWGMVLGGNLDQPLTGFSPGQHTIETYLANGDHEELIEGDSIMILVEQ